MTERHTDIRRAMLVRHYLNLAEANRKIDNDFSNFLFMHLLHEALEATLITICDFIDAKTKTSDNIPQYIDSIERSIARSLSLRKEVLRFNRARVSAKHALTLPSSKDLKDFATAVPLFCRAILADIANVDLDTANLIELIESDPTRAYLLSAQDCIKSDQFYEALIEIRKAFYTEFESQFDIRPFKDKASGERYGIFDPRSRVRAPLYARSNRYIEEHVKTPLDYIVLDMQLLENDCLKNGVDTNDFWNIWRLTPKLIKQDDDDWKVQKDNKFSDDHCRDHAPYLLSTMIDILLVFQQSRSKAKYNNASELWIVRGKVGSQVFSKCSQNSAAVRVVDESTNIFTTDTLEPSLDDSSYFWRVVHLAGSGPFFSGFLHEDDVEGSPLDYDPTLLGLRVTASDTASSG